MKMTEQERCLNALRMIRDDMAADVAALDGQPFDGPTVAVALGQLGAAISVLASIIETMIEAEVREP